MKIRWRVKTNASLARLSKATGASPSTLREEVKETKATTGEAEEGGWVGIFVGEREGRGEGLGVPVAREGEEEGMVEGLRVGGFEGRVVGEGTVRGRVGEVDGALVGPPLGTREGR
jgi:hypothetical protein